MNCELELLSMRRKDFGTKCSWGLLPLGQNIVGTLGIWDKSLDFLIFLEKKFESRSFVKTLLIYS